MFFESVTTIIPGVRRFHSLYKKALKQVRHCCNLFPTLQSYEKEMLQNYIGRILTEIIEYGDDYIMNVLSVTHETDFKLKVPGSMN